MALHLQFEISLYWKINPLVSNDTNLITIIHFNSQAVSKAPLSLIFTELALQMLFSKEIVPIIL